MSLPDNPISRADDRQPAGTPLNPADTGVGRLGDLLELAPVAVIVRNFSDDVITNWSQGAADLYGWSRHEAVGQVSHTLLRTTFPVSLEDARESLRRARRWEGELVHLRRDGALVVVASRQAVRVDVAGDPISTVEINIDITQRKRMEDDLRATEERFRLLVDGVHDHALYLLSPDGTVMMWNEGAARMTGYRSEEVLGNSFNRFYLAEDIARGVPQGLLARATAEGRVAAEGWRVRQDGTRFWAEVVVTALWNEHCELRGFAKVTRDVTERRLAEEDRARAQRDEAARIEAEARQVELRMSRDHLASILGGVADGITVQNAVGQLIYANDAAARLCGFPDAATFLATPVTEILQRFVVTDEAGNPFPSDQFPGRKLFLDEPAVETLLQFQVVASGDSRWSLLNATPIYDSAGKVYLAVNIFHDVTQRRRAEEAERFLAAASVELTSSLDYEQTLARIAQLAVPDLADWCVVDVVRADGQIHRLAAAHVEPAKVQLAQDLTRRYPEDPRSPTGVARVLRTGRSELVPEVTEAQLVAGARDADHLALLRSLQIRSALIVPLIAGGRTLGAITFVQTDSRRRFGPRDLTLAEELAVRAGLAVENARLYEEARHQADSYVALNEVLRDAMSRLQDVLRTRDEFLAAASHDLKNPIASIKLTAQLLSRRMERSDGVTLAKIREDLMRIDGIATRAGVLVDELLDIARLQMGQQLDLDRQSMDLVTLTRDVVAEYQQLNEGHQIHLTSDTPSLVGWWDRHRLARAISNVLDNAVKYSPEGGLIDVRISREVDDGDWIVMTIDDEGVGIRSDDLERVFERFQRGSNVIGMLPGTGIGLASARQIIEAHGGSIKASVRPDRGTRFTLQLPARSDDSAPRRSDDCHVDGVSIYVK